MTTKKIVLTATAIAALAAPGMAQARQGADDPAGHVRHSGADDVRGAKHAKKSSKARSRARQHRGRGADDAPGHVRHGRGTDDGPNHR
jgi:Ni/Co efflux regulator RcnB